MKVDHCRMCHRSAAAARTAVGLVEGRVVASSTEDNRGQMMRRGENNNKQRAVAHFIVRVVEYAAVM